MICLCVDLVAVLFIVVVACKIVTWRINRITCQMHIFDREIWLSILILRAVSVTLLSLLDATAILLRVYARVQPLIVLVALIITVV